MRILAVIVGLAAAVALEAGTTPTIERFLTTSFGFSRDDLAALRDRRAAVRALPSTDSREVATVGAIVIEASPRSYVARLRNVASFKRGENVSQIGVFSRSPVIGDTDALTLPEKDRRSLAGCRPSRCDVQLPGDAIERMTRDVAWRSQAEADQANAAFRAELARIAATYVGLGEAGMPVYHDTPSSTSTAVEFRSMVWDEPAILREFDQLSEHLRGFPRATPGVEDLLYWSREKVGGAEVISITHLSIQAVVDRAPVTFIAASRQVYSTHYFDASLGLTILLAESPDAGSTVVVYVNRSRVDVFGGLLGSVKRSIAASRSRAALGKFLTGVRHKVEGR